MSYILRLFAADVQFPINNTIWLAKLLLVHVSLLLHVHSFYLVTDIPIYPVLVFNDERLKFLLGRSIQWTVFFFCIFVRAAKKVHRPAK